MCTAGPIGSFIGVKPCSGFFLAGNRWGYNKRDYCPRQCILSDTYEGILPPLQQCFASLHFLSSRIHQGGHYVMYSHGARVRVCVRFLFQQQQQQQATTISAPKTNQNSTADASSTSHSTTSASKSANSSSTIFRVVANVVLSVVPGQVVGLAVAAGSSYPDCLARFCLVDQYDVQAIGVVRRLMNNYASSSANGIGIGIGVGVGVDTVMISILECLQLAPPTSALYSYFSFLPTDVIRYILCLLARIVNNRSSMRKTRREGVKLAKNIPNTRKSPVSL
jgi:hypothetical protein